MRGKQQILIIEILEPDSSFYCYFIDFKKKLYLHFKNIDPLCRPQKAERGWRNLLRTDTLK